MSTGTDIILGSLKEIGVHSIAKPAAPEVIEDAFIDLGSMLQEWLTDGMEIPITPLNVPGSELNESTDLRNAIKFNLAIYIAPGFSNGVAVNVSPELRRLALLTLDLVKKVYRPNIIPKRRFSSTTARGQGNIRGRNSRIFFSNKESQGG